MGNEMLSYFFSKEGIINNIGAFIIIPIIIFQFILMILFYIKDFPIIKMKINSIIFNKKNITISNIKPFLKTQIIGNKKKSKYAKSKKSDKNKLKKIEKENKGFTNNNKVSKIKKELKKDKDPLEEIKNKNEKKDQLIHKHLIMLKTKNVEKKTPPKKNFKRLNKKSINLVKTCDNFSDKSKNIINMNKSIINSNSKRESKYITNLNIGIKIDKTFMIKNDYELNILKYEDALKIDKRSLIEYYFSLLKINHLLFFLFRKNDYNSLMIKIYLFFFSFDLYFAVNTLFFSDSTMHKIYDDGGTFDFIYQIPQILYSSIISSIINTLVKYFSLSEKKILEIKNEMNIENLDKKANDEIKILTIKFKLFFIISFAFILFFWYYISCFCAVYKNTQLHLIKDTIISFGLSLLYPFGFYLIPGIFRIYSLRSSEKNRQCLYKFSNIIQLL